MARHDPKQGDMFAPDSSRAIGWTALEKEIHEAIQDILPPGVPTYVREVFLAKRDRSGAIIADLVVFDGHMHRLRISGQPGGRGYAWQEDPRSPMDPFSWDGRKRRWVRHPEDRHLPSVVA
ncbi:hypothetical protein B2G69_08155 [Methylorubrum zatmanii]|nr:hypothetical protein B2G69_08155 [Methylorubrum zatmanii]